MSSNNSLMKVDLLKSDKPVDYNYALNFMQNRVKKIINNNENSLLWLLEHPHVYTAGTSASDSELIDKNKAPVIHTGRGGKYTYHGPGQIITYIMLNIKKVHDNKPDLRKFINQLEQWIINTLKDFHIIGERRNGRIGIWTLDKNGNEIKLAAIGIRIEKWVSYHGISINLNPDMSFFDGIIPCGITDFKAGSIEMLNIKLDKDEFIKTLIKNFAELFNVSLENA